jgi:Ca2+-transporting ATPase
MMARPIDVQEAATKSANSSDPTLLSEAELARAFAVDIDLGLTSSEAALRLSRDGPNELPAAVALPPWRRFLRHFQDPLIYLLCAAVLISLAAWMMEGHNGWPVDAIVIGLVILLNGILGFLQEAKAQDAVAALSKMTAQVRQSCVMASSCMCPAPS